MRSPISLSGDAPFSLWAVATSVGEKGGGAGTSDGSRGDSSGSGMGGQNSGGASTGGTGTRGSSAGAGTAGGQNSGSSSGGSRGSSAGAGSAGGQNSSSSGASRGSSAGAGSAGGVGGGMGGNSNSMGGGNGGGLNSAGNRASGAGPGASANRSTTAGGFGGTTTGSPSNFGGMNSPRGVGSPTSGGMGGGLNAAGNRASGAGPGASANTTTTGNGFGVQTDAERRADQAQQARASELTSMKDLSRERALGAIAQAEVGKKDPYNTLSGGLIGNITNMTVKEAIAFAKTKWDGKLANVIGAYQVKDATLKAVAEKLGLMDAKMTPAVQDQIAVGLLQERANRATVNGQIDVDKFAQEISKEWASVADPTTGVSHYAKNGIDKASISAAAAREIAKDLVANGVVTAGKSVSSITSRDVSSYQTNAPGVSRFSSTYMGSKETAAAPSTSPSGPGFGGMNSPRGVSSGSVQTASATQQNDPSSLPPGNYPAYDPSGLPPASAPRPAQAPAPAAPVQAPVQADKPRSLGQKVAAGAIDAGLGMVPGIGTAISVINGGLALTGNKTLGERTVDSFMNGEGGAGPDSGASRHGGGRNDRQIIESRSTVPKQEESFEDRYMKYVDPTPRQKPSERWNYDTSGYA